MSPTLIADGREFEIASDVWGAWKQRAQPFESPDDVLRRAFGIDNASVDRASMSSDADLRARRPDPDVAREQSAAADRRARAKVRRSRVPSHLLLPESEYEVPILRALADAGGRQPTREVVEAVGQMLGDRLKDADKESLPNGGGPRWMNRTQFARLRLVRDGLLKDNSPRGVWEISDAGQKRLAKEGA